MILILISYGYMKADIMLNFLDNTIQEPSTKNYFDFDYEYDSSDGWRVAFALVAYDSSSDPTPLDDTYGKLGVYLKKWGMQDENGNNIPTGFTELDTVPCKASDINLEGDENVDNYLFYEPSEEFIGDAKRFHS